MILSREGSGVQMGGNGGALVNDILPIGDDNSAHVMVAAGAALNINEETIMSTVTTDQDAIKSVRTPLLIAGVLLSLVGAIGIFLPGVLSLAIEIFLGWLMIVGGILWGYYAYHAHSPSFISWLKPVILLVGGILLLVYPVSGIAAITLLVSFYLLTDAFGSFSLAFERRPLPGWVWMMLNGLLSLTLAVLILVGWPVTSPIYLGIIVGISLLFDGVSLFMLGVAMKKG